MYEYTINGAMRVAEHKSGISERQILFSAPMVRAILAGAKTQTRRVVKLPTKGEYVRPDMGGWEASTVGGAGCTFRNGEPAPERACVWNRTTGTVVGSLYEPGDLLWVRETWAHDGPDPSSPESDAFYVSFSFGYSGFSTQLSRLWGRPVRSVVLPGQ